MSRTRRATGLLVSGLAAALILSGCSGDDASAEDQPVDAQSSTGSTSASPSTSETPTPSASSSPLSRFEDDPAVKSARAWAVAAAESINARQQDLTKAKPYMTTHGQEVIPPLAAQEIGLEYPGPVPFTPTEVSHSGSKATLEVCFWSAGFGLDRDSGQPSHARKIVPMQFAMVRQGGTWKIDALYSSKASCGSVPVKGVGF